MCVCMIASRCVCIYVCAKVCFCSSLSAQYPSAAKPSINLSTPQPTVSPFLFPLAFLPSFPFISHLSLSLSPYPTSSLSPTHSPHFRQYQAMLPLLDRKHAYVLSMFFRNEQNNGSFLSACFNSSREKKNSKVAVTRLPLLSTHKLIHTHQDLFIWRRPFPPLLGAPTGSN